MRKKILCLIKMLISAYAYSLYHDKMRQTSPEFFFANQASTNNNDNTTQKQQQEEAAGYFWYFVAAFVIEVFLLFYSIPLAMKLARTRGELTLHLFFAIFATPAYLFVAVAGQLLNYTLFAGGTVA